MSNSHIATTPSPSWLSRIQAPVEHRLDGVVEQMRRILLSDFEMHEEVNDYLLKMRGKLFRPTLLLLTNEVAGTPHPDAMSLAAVVEMVHLATLVHDDAVDHSVLRRGMPTVNHIWTHQVAIITGDYLYARSVAELARVGRLEAIAALAEASSEMSVGELRQLTSYDALDFTEVDYERLISCKTASLMAAACEIGALVGCEPHRAAFRRFGHALGMAFQIADDLLDYTGSEEVTGKPTGHDLRERKVTLPLLEALRQVGKPDGDRIREFFTLLDPSDSEIGEIVEIVVEHGGLEYARERARHFAELAVGALSEVDEEGDAMDALHAAISYSIERTR
ncbi:MAG: polyprenyl synthetase family protein [Gemmatimonadota bacterium]